MSPVPSLQKPDQMKEALHQSSACQYAVAGCEPFERHCETCDVPWGQCSREEGARAFCFVGALGHMEGMCSLEDIEGRIELETAGDIEVGMAVAWDAAYRVMVLASQVLADMRTDWARSLDLRDCPLNEVADVYFVVDCCNPPCIRRCSHCRQPLAADEDQELFVPFAALPCEVPGKNRSKPAKQSGSLDVSVWSGRQMVHGSLASEALAQGACG